MDQELIAKKIKELRIKNNLTQKEFADKMNVTFQAVSKWENGKSIPDISILKKISEEFNINIVKSNDCSAFICFECSDDFCEVDEKNQMKLLIKLKMKKKIKSKILKK